MLSQIYQLLSILFMRHEYSGMKASCSLLGFPLPTGACQQRRYYYPQKVYSKRIYSSSQVAFCSAHLRNQAWNPPAKLMINVYYGIPFSSYEEIYRNAVLFYYALVCPEQVLLKLHPKPALFSVIHWLCCTCAIGGCSCKTAMIFNKKTGQPKVDRFAVPKGYLTFVVGWYFAAVLSKSFRLAPCKGIVSVCFFESSNNAKTRLGVRRNNYRRVFLIQLSKKLLAVCINLHRYASFSEPGGKKQTDIVRMAKGAPPAW